MPVALGARAVLCECSLHAAVTVVSGMHACSCCLGKACWSQVSLKTRADLKEVWPWVSHAWQQQLPLVGEGGMPLPSKRYAYAYAYAYALCLQAVLAKSGLGLAAVWYQTRFLTGSRQVNHPSNW
jgi:hypothetical protein